MLIADIKFGILTYLVLDNKLKNMKIIKLIFTIIGCTVLTLNVFSQDKVTVAISAKVVHGFASVLNGTDFGLRNVETNIIYRSKSLHRFLSMSRHSLIEDLPSGKYEMLYIGSHEYERIDSVIVNFFGILDFTKDGVYYLGNFRGKIPQGWDMPCYFKLLNTDMPKRLTKVLRRRGILTGDHNLVTYPIYESESFIMQSSR